MSSPADLLPLLGPREAWVIGTGVVLAVLRPVGRLGWAVAGAVIAGGLGAVATSAGSDLGAWALLPWGLLAVLLLAAAAGSPLRWEPRTGPSAAAALLAAAVAVHIGAAWHAAGGALPELAARWAEGEATAAGAVAGAPLVLTGLWGLSRLVPAELAAALLSIGAAAGLVAGVAVVARRWGHTGTSRSTAAAVAWAPPVLLAHGTAPAELVAAVALLWSWWALGEVWTGRHLPNRMALVSGATFGAAVGSGLWAVLLLPLWLRRVAGRKLEWFLVGLAGGLAATLLALIPAGADPTELWRTGVVSVLRAGPLPAATVATAVVVAGGAGLRAGRLTPTRLSAVTAAVLLALTPWWPAGWSVTGPVVAVPFLLLAAVAPDRPGERWPPDAPVVVDTVEVVV